MPSVPPTEPAAAEANQPVRWFVAVLGGLIVSLGASGLIDDSGLAEHPWWVPLVAAVVLGALTMIIRTARAVAASSGSTQ